MKCKIEKLSFNMDGTQSLILTLLFDFRPYFDKLKDKVLSLDLKIFRETRSLDSNAYLWVLLGKIADALNTNKDDVYLEMLSRYGVFTHMIVKPEAAERVKSEWRTARELGEVTVNGKTGVQLQCYFGSSTYDTKEMAVLLGGVVEEAKELGIETMTPDEIAKMNSRWAS